MRIKQLVTRVHLRQLILDAVVVVAAAAAAAVAVVVVFSFILSLSATQRKQRRIAQYTHKIQRKC